MSPIRLSENSVLSSNNESNEAIFRSAPMTLVQFYVTIELARDMVGVLGKLGNVQFRDLNSKLTPFQRTFITELRSIDGLVSQLDFLHSIMIKQNTIKSDLYVNLHADMKPLPTSSEIDNIKTRLSEFYERIKHLDQSYNNLDRKRLKFIENRCVLNSLNEFHRSNLVGGGYDDEHTEDADYDDNAALLNEQRNHSLEIGYEAHNLDDISFNSLAGTIARDKVPILRNILWRVLRGNLYFHDIALDDEFPATESSMGPSS